MHSKKVRPMRTSRLPFGALAALIAISGPSLASAPDTPTASSGTRAAQYQRLTTDWACSTLRLYLRERSSTNEEAGDWGQGSWRLLEVVRAIKTLPAQSRCISASVLADIRRHVDIIEARAARVEEAYRVFWLMDLLGQIDQGSNPSVHPSSPRQSARCALPVGETTRYWQPSRIRRLGKQEFSARRSSRGCNNGTSK